MTATSGTRPARALRARLVDAGIASFIGLLLGIPLVGLTTVDTGGRLAVETRWHWLVVAVVVIFPCRLLLRWLYESHSVRGRGQTMWPPSALGDPNKWTPVFSTLAIPIA